MAITHHDDLSSNKSQNHCALMFCLTWVGFFALIGLATFLMSLF
jgi:hypothetical protein